MLTGEDFKLVCTNCMAFNPPESIYHLEAERLLLDVIQHDSCSHLVKGMKAANRAREKVSPEFYDTNSFYDPYNDNFDSE